MRDPAVETRDLVKVFERGRRTIWQRLRREPDRRDRFRAVDGIDLRVEAGEIFGLLGPNGAGKTTTMKMLATLLIPTSGTIRVLGIDPLARPREVRARLGAMLSGERSLYWKLTGRENLEYFAALYHVPPAETTDRITRCLVAVNLSDRADDYVERYSTGMRQRLALARALLPDPPLIILDEPTVGLDPQASRDLRDRVRELRAQGRTVLLTTHYMEEADQLCDRVAIIDHGRIVALDTPAAVLPSAWVLMGRAYSGNDPGALAAFAARAGSENVTVFVFVGYAMYMWLSSLLWGPGTILRQEQVRGTLEAVFLTPASRIVPLFAPGVTVLIPMSLSFLVMGGALWLFFGIVPPVAAILRAAVIVALGVPALYAIGSLFSAAVLRFGEIGPIVQLVRGVFVLACGITFPVAMLPIWAQVGAWILPPTYIVDDIRRVLLRGAGLGELWPNLLTVVLIAAVTAMLAVLVFRYLEASARRSGMLGRF